MFYELDFNNLFSLFSFDSFVIRALIDEKNSQYFNFDNPIFFLNDEF